MRWHWSEMDLRLYKGLLSAGCKVAKLDFMVCKWIAEEEWEDKYQARDHSVVITHGMKVASLVLAAPSVMVCIEVS